MFNVSHNFFELKRYCAKNDKNNKNKNNFNERKFQLIIIPFCLMLLKHIYI